MVNSAKGMGLLCMLKATLNKTRSLPHHITLENKNLPMNMHYTAEYVLEILVEPKGSN